MTIKLKSSGNFQKIALFQKENVAIVPRGCVERWRILERIEMQKRVDTKMQKKSRYRMHRVRYTVSARKKMIDTEIQKARYSEMQKIRDTKCRKSD